MTNKARVQLPNVFETITLNSVTVDADQVAELSKRRIQRRTAREFERVQNGYMYKGRLLAAIDRRYQARKGREYRPIDIVAEEKRWHDSDALKLVSPVIRMDDRSGVYCITVNTSSSDLYDDSNFPLVASVSSEARKRLELLGALEEADHDDQRMTPNYYFEPMGIITKGTYLTPEQKTGLAAVYLGLRASSAS